MKYIPKIICILLLLTSLAVLLVPCWQEAGESVSAADYILQPDEHKDLTKHLRDVTDKKDLTTRYALPIFLLLVTSAIGAVIGLIKIKTIIPNICTVLVGALGLFVYLTNVVLKSGAITAAGMIVSVVMLLWGLADLFLFRMNKRGD